MVALMLIAVVRARAEFDTSRLVTWLMLGGLLAVLLGSGYLWYTMAIPWRGVSGFKDRVRGFYSQSNQQGALTTRRA